MEKKQKQNHCIPDPPVARARLGPQVSLYGFGSPYTSWEWRRRQRGPEEGLLVTQRSAVTAWAGAACQAQLARCVPKIRPALDRSESPPKVV